MVKPPAIKIFADGADLAIIEAFSKSEMVEGFTTNPTLMRKGGVKDYKTFAMDVLRLVPDKPVSFEVFGDDFDTMALQAREIASWGPNVYVKIPVTNSKGVWSIPLITALAWDGIKVNVTAVMTQWQVRAVTDALCQNTPAIISVFAGRIADTGVDPVPMMEMAKTEMERRPKAELLWASPRETLNVYQAYDCGCDIITLSPEQIAKLFLFGKDLAEYSRETVEMFHRDAMAAGYSIPLEH